MMSVPKSVSIIIPCRNEESFIAACLDSILDNDYPRDRMEILVVDGMSDDATRSIMERYTKQCQEIKLIDNPRRITSCALNLGIAGAKGECILWMSAHNRYPKNYISLCVESLERYKVDNVGGAIVTVPRKKNLIGSSIAIALSHIFGVGNSYFRIRTKKPRDVDTLFGGCYRREVFSRVGLFNEKLVRGQDVEFNLRLRRAGGKILLIPDIVSYYYARTDIRSFIKHNWTNGVWSILPFLYSQKCPVSWRHMMPLAFVLTLLGGTCLSVFEPRAIWVVLAVIGMYLLCAIIASIHVSITKSRWRYCFIMPFVFATLHLSYGLGALWGSTIAICRRMFGTSSVESEVINTC